MPRPPLPRSPIQKLPPAESRIPRRRSGTTVTFSRLITRLSIPFLLKKIRKAAIFPKLRYVWEAFADDFFNQFRALVTRTPTPPLRMRAESFQVAGRSRIEDCHFIHGSGAIGVADGVGGFRKRGIDPGEHAEELMLNALAGVIHRGGGVDPYEIMKQAHVQTTKPGGSTACMLTLAGRELLTVHVGDSGFKVFRRNRAVYESRAQLRKFNAPVKLRAGRGGMSLRGVVMVKPGDVVVVGTGGLFDNLHTREMEGILSESSLKLKSESESEGSDCDGNSDVKELARIIALTAFRNSVDEDYSSPFEARCLKHGFIFRGGKRDDITVVVARIEESTD